MHHEELLHIAVEAARAGGRELLDQFRHGGLEVRLKGDNDPVTSADGASERAVVEVIRAHCPEDAILAEESGAQPGRRDRQWVIDPLDGTNNFLQGLPLFCVSVACLEAGLPVAAVVLDPVRGELFRAVLGGGAWCGDRRLRVSSVPSLDGAFLATGYPFRAHAALDLYLQAFRAVFLRARGIRRCGAAALDLAWTAAGVFDGFFEFRLSPWDLAAGVLLVAEAGGRLTDLDGGDRYFESGNVVAGGERVWQDLLHTVRRFADETTLAVLEPQDGTVLC